MDKLSLNETLRYGLAGGLFLLSEIISFQEAYEIVSKLPSNFLGASTVLGIVLIAGSLIYAVHRAVLYPIIYKMVSMVVYRRKDIDTRALDANRWKRIKDPESLQHRFSEWASQIHFLYCSLWAIVLSLVLGPFIEWSSTGLNILTWLLALIIGVSALISHYRYLRYEQNIFGGESG